MTEQVSGARGRGGGGEEEEEEERGSGTEVKGRWEVDKSQDIIGSWTLLSCTIASFPGQKIEIFGLGTRLVQVGNALAQS